jgi:acetyl-CoA carboxylase biotin carboxyl carrier protein
MPKKTNKKAMPGVEVGGVDLAEVERLLAFMEKHGLEEFEYARGSVHIRLKKPSAATASAPPRPAGWDTPPAGHAAPSETPRPATHPTAPPASDVHVIKSPIVGTFYGKPSPDASDFVTVGAKVEPGQTLCIIEAMKLMNEIESDVAGEIAQIFVENGKPVEYGEPLFGIRPRGKK